MALGGSTNAVVHLLAIAGRLGIPSDARRFRPPLAPHACIANIKPSGEYVMEDFFYAGGLPAVMRNILPLLHRDCLTVNGKRLGENVENAQPATTMSSAGRAGVIARRRHGDPARQSVPGRRRYQADRPPRPTC